jgi:uncharacterized protein (DUF58 family)
MGLDNQEDREPTIFSSLLILFFVGIFLFLALLYRQNDLTLLAIMVFILIGGTRIWGSLSPTRIHCTNNIDSRRVFPGETVTLITKLENRKWLPVSVRIFWPSESGLQPHAENGAGIQRRSSVLWHQAVEFRQRFTALQRGVYALGISQIRTSDMLGFFEKKIRTSDSTQLIVYPRIVPLYPVSARQKEFFEIPGAKSPVQDPIYILGTRDYQPASPSRHIHWKASARHQRIQEKVFEPSEQEKVLLVVDSGSFREPNAKEALETTLEVAASLAVVFDQKGYAVGMATNGLPEKGHSSSIPIDRNPNQITAILEKLARIKMKKDRALKRVVGQALGSRRKLSCFHFCHASGQPVIGMVKYYKERRIPVTFLAYCCDDNTLDFSWQDGIRWYSIDDIHSGKNSQ